MQIPESILLLIEKYRAGTATAEEKRQLDEWYHSFNDTEAELLTDEGDNEEQLADRIKDKLFNTINYEKPRAKQAPRRIWRIAAAAVLLAVLGAGSYFIIFNRNPKQEIANIT